MNEYDELIDAILEYWQVTSDQYSPIEKYGDIYLISTEDSYHGSLLVYCTEIRKFIARIDDGGTLYLLRSTRNLDIDDFLSELEDAASERASRVKIVREINF